jgi:hypothetical protein
MYLIKQGIVPIKITRATESAGNQWMIISFYFLCFFYILTANKNLKEELRKGE